MDWDYSSAIELLKKGVNDSHLDDQKYIDLTLFLAETRPKAQSALAYVKSLVAQGEIDEAKLKEDLGL